MKQAELIETAKEATGKTDAELSRTLNVPRQTVRKWKTNDAAIPDHHIIDLARLAGLDPAETIVKYHAEKADMRARDVWKEIARRASHAAVLLLAVGLLMGLAPHPTDAGVKRGGGTGIVYYVN